jgi:hypothetical protein
MKKLILVFGCFGFFALSAMAESWTGYIVDKNCSTKPAMLGNEACAQKCIKGGSPAVLATDDGKVYAIANQDKVTSHAGHKVTVSGKLDKDTITVDNVKM